MSPGATGRSPIRSRPSEPSCKSRAISPATAVGRVAETAAGAGARVVEDAACGFDAWIGPHHAGTFGDAGCFSFHPRKSSSIRTWLLTAKAFSANTRSSASLLAKPLLG